MRYAVLADIHGNLPALEAALEAVRREGVDAVLCLGDLVGYGPFPNECVAAVAALDAACVAGNHDLMALGLLPDDRCIRLARETLAWTREALQEKARAYLAALPRRLSPCPEIVLAHGSLDDAREYVTRAEQAEEQLSRLQAEHPAARLLLLGHTHRPMVCPEGGPVERGRTTAPVSLDDGRAYLLNPGSVGQSREREAGVSFLLLDLAGTQAMFHRVPYDDRPCREALRRHGLPENACHLKPNPLRQLARKVRRWGQAVAAG